MMYSDVDIIPGKREYRSEEERMIARNAIEKVKQDERARSDMYRRVGKDAIEVKISERRQREAEQEGEYV